MVLDNRVALVTGGGRGIGRAIALAFAREGAHVAVAGRTAAAIEAVAAEARALGRKALAVPCDVGDRTQVDAAVRLAQEALGPIQILVNNAGIAVSAKLADTDDALWERHLRVNLTGAFSMARAVLPGMLAAGWGRIINVASTAAKQGYPYVAAYVASKHGLLGLTRALAMELATSGITVNAICPGYAATDLTWESARRIQEKTGRSYEEAVRSLAAFSPQRRLVEPEEVAALAVLLASDDARGVTGQAWNVDGGAVQS
ncbi:MAG: 3-oxoacyl-ACP reductase FabG [Candidatus Rokubacteria bacterium]|nr:3-oxoacyl-ACP reductase FabG [Candidatus Rokubacteria bacterium]